MMVKSLRAAVTIGSMLLLTAPVIGSAKACQPDWRLVHADGSDSIRRISASSARDVWAVGSHRVRGSDIPLVERWDGRNWRVMPAPRVGRGNGGVLVDVSAVSSDDVWAVGSVLSSSGDESRLLVHWDGSAWTVVPRVPLPRGLSNPDYVSDEFQAVLALSRKDVWVIAGVNVRYPAVIFAQHWDGSRWRVFRVPERDVSVLTHQISAVSSSDIWAAGVKSCGPGCDREFTVHWNGRRWSDVPAGVRQCGGGGGERGFSAIAALTQTDVWAVGTSEIFKDAPECAPFVKRWDGRRWRMAPRRGLPGKAEFDDMDSRGADIWAFGSNYSQTRPVVAHWAGQTWSLLPAPRLRADADRHLLVTGAVVAPNDIWAASGVNVAHYACG